MDSFNRNEEEYKPQTNNGFDGFAEAKPDKTAIFEQIRRNHIITVVVILVMGWGLYKLADKFIFSPNPKVIQRANKTPIVKPTSVASSPTVSAASNDSRLAKLEVNIAGLQSDLERLVAQIGDIQSNFTTVEGKLESLQDSVQQIQTQQRQWLIQQAARKKKSLVVKKVAPKSIYYVRAIIPGRAWLVTQEGSTVTVGVGDKVAGYGSVQLIDPNQGIVTFDSGAIIGFNPNDS